MNIKKEETGKYFLDLSKIVFASTVLANIGEIEKFFSLIIFLAGCVTTVLLFKIC